MTTDLFYINSSGNSDNIERGFDWLRRIAMNGNNSKALLFVRAKKSLDAPDLKKVLTPQERKDLKAGKSKLIKGTIIKLITQQSLLPPWEGPVLEIYPDRKLLNKCDQLSSPSDVLVVPWAAPSGPPVRPWGQKWSAKIY